MDLDKKDFALIEALQQNASQRLEDLARMVQLAPSSVHDRLRRLERDGVIRNWTIKLDAPALGLGVLAFVGIRATKPCSELLEALRAIPSIEECHSVAGELSLILKVRPQGSLQNRPYGVTSKAAMGRFPELRCCTLPFAFRASLICEISRWKLHFLLGA